MDLEARHLVLHIVPWHAATWGPSRARGRPKAAGPAPRWLDVAGKVEEGLGAAFPGILVDRLEQTLRAILPLAGAGDAEELGSLGSMDWGEGTGSGLSVGVSNVCVGVRAYLRGFAEAESAAEVGALIKGAPGVTGFDELGPYRYVLESEDPARDRTQQQLQRLVDYDERRGTQLLDTLEGYLDHRGNVVGTSRALFIHPNTLRQRLGRAERVSGIDLERDDWLSLAVATKVVKLRRLREAARAEEKGE
jgi:hypothetical protein